MYKSLPDARPPPMDPSDSAVEFSQTHFSRDDDLISLQIEPHRYMYTCVHVHIALPIPHQDCHGEVMFPVVGLSLMCTYTCMGSEPVMKHVPIMNLRA